MSLVEADRSAVVIGGATSEERRATEPGDLLVSKLERLIDDQRVWEPVRYQVGAGMGWYHFAHQVEGLCDRLIVRCSVRTL